jgi:hypothetical protein
MKRKYPFDEKQRKKRKIKKTKFQKFVSNIQKILSQDDYYDKNKLYDKENEKHIREKLYTKTKSKLKEILEKYKKKKKKNWNTKKKRELVDYIVSYLFHKKISKKKRKMEIKNITNLEYRITFWNKIIPKELILFVFSYMVKNQSFLNTIILVNGSFLYLCIGILELFIYFKQKFV